MTLLIGWKSNNGFPWGLSTWREKSNIIRCIGDDKHPLGNYVNYSLKREWLEQKIKMIKGYTPPAFLKRLHKWFVTERFPSRKKIAFV